MAGHGRGDGLGRGRTALGRSPLRQVPSEQRTGKKQGPMGIPGFRAVANRPRQSLQDVVRWLSSVSPMMPNHKLTTNEIDALAAFIMSLRKRK
jgi:hypothetical protein